MTEPTEGLAIARLLSQRRWATVGLLGFIPVGLTAALLGQLVAGDIGAALGIACGGLGVLALAVVQLSRLTYARCPRCGDYVHSGLLKARNPELSSFGVLGLLLRWACVNCGLRLDSTGSNSLGEHPERPPNDALQLTKPAQAKELRS